VDSESFIVVGGVEGCGLAIADIFMKEDGSTRLTGRWRHAFEMVKDYWLIPKSSSKPLLGISYSPLMKSTIFRLYI
jgi:hypothetical protein